jgi:hypothetical protein
MVRKMPPERDGFPTPARRSGVMARPLVAAGFAFTDAASADSLHARELVAWFSAWFVEPGVMPLPASVHEPGAGMVSLALIAQSKRASGHVDEALEARLGRIVTAARTRVGTTLAGLLASPADDRFLSAAIFASRVERSSSSQGSVWRPTPRGTERLSDVVLTLFAADILGNREEYDACLCVCSVCGRVALRTGALDRTRCLEHEGALGE